MKWEAIDAGANKCSEALLGKSGQIRGQLLTRASGSLGGRCSLARAQSSRGAHPDYYGVPYICTPEDLYFVQWCRTSSGRPAAKDCGNVQLGNETSNSGGGPSTALRLLK